MALREFTKEQMAQKIVEQHEELTNVKRNCEYFKAIMEKKNQAADHLKNLLEETNEMFQDCNIGYQFDYSRYNAQGRGQAGNVRVIKTDGWHRADGPVTSVRNLNRTQQELESEKAAKSEANRQFHEIDVQLNEEIESRTAAEEELESEKAANKKLSTYIDYLEFELASMTKLPAEPKTKRGPRVARKRILAAGGENFDFDYACDKRVTRSMSLAKRAKMV